MIAVDTNILVRLLTHDDPKQTTAAERLLANGQIWIAKTVLLESAWVLQSVYGLDQAAICGGLSALLGLPNVSSEDEAGVAAALLLAQRGVDLADAFHYCSRPPGAGFVTFDRNFVSRARRAGETAIQRHQA